MYTTGGGITVSLELFDTVTVVLLVLVMVGVILALCHLLDMRYCSVGKEGGEHINELLWSESVKRPQRR
jgi:hypothetical protein